MIDKEYLNLKTKITKRNITIFGCGKFNEEKITLGKAEASLLYLKLHEFLSQK